VTRIDANDLARTTDCKIHGCTRESLGAAKGPYAGLCDEHTEAARRRKSESATRPPGDPPADGVSLAVAAAALVKPARALEAAVATRRSANATAKERLAEFNTALNAVRAAAEALLR
jgi:hypothetical protein